MPSLLSASRAERPPGYDIVKYEDGMQILYDVLSKGVFIQFRSKSDFLKGPFQTSGRRYALRRIIAESSDGASPASNNGPGEDGKRLAYIAVSSRTALLSDRIDLPHLLHR